MRWCSGALGLAGWLLAIGAVLAAPTPLGIALEELAYPFPVAFLRLTLAGQELRLAYMDVAPTAQANGQTVLLLHGRNFPASYWQTTIGALAASGYRVVAPDQIGFGKSSKPTFDYHFDVLARTTVMLLDELRIPRAHVVAHSMGGMLAVALCQPMHRVSIVWCWRPRSGSRTTASYVPPVQTDHLIEHERELSAEQYQQQLETNYALSPEAVAPFVEIRERLKQSGEYPRWLRSFANSFQMIYREPVVDQFPLIHHHTLFIMGERDHNAPGRALAPAELRPMMGHNLEHAQRLAGSMPSARVEVLEGVGHVPHLQIPAKFNELILGFLTSPH